MGSAVTKTISTTGVAVTTASAVVSAVFISPMSFPEIFLLLSRIIGLLLTAVGLKKRVVPWGVVYDAVTKQPLDPVYVVLKNSKGKNISSAITDLDGRYGFLVEPGIYQIVANKTNYVFPSQKLAGKIKDEFYNELYFGEKLEVKTLGETITKNIPLDPVKFDWNEFAKKDKNLMKFYSKLGLIIRKTFDYLFIVGFIVALVTLLYAPYPYNMAIMALYLLLLLLRFLGLKPKSYGSILDKATGNPLSFAIARIIMPDINKEVAHRVADKYGRYYCLVPKGKYYVKIEKKNNDGSYSLIYTSSIVDASKKGIINRKFEI